MPNRDRPKFQMAMEELRDICYVAGVILAEKHIGFFKQWQPSPKVMAKIEDILGNIASAGTVTAQRCKTCSDEPK